MDVVLGEFLDLADECFVAAGSALREDGLRDYVGVTRELGRLAVTGNWYLAIVTRPEVTAGDDVPDWELTAAYMREGMKAAAAYLDQAAGSAVGERPEDDPAVRQLGHSVDALAAGGDLLWTHVSVDPGGKRVPRSDWARMLSTEPAALAVADEVTGWARRAVNVLDRMTSVPGQLQGLLVPPLHGARDLLAAVADTHRQGGSSHSDMVSRRDLLRSLPARALPSRVAPGTGESDAQLCEGITISARRLRGAAFGASRLSGNSPFLTRDRWLKTAQASAIISDVAAEMTEVLADRTGALGMPTAAETGLRDAGDAFTRACTAWRQVTRMWRTVRTDTSFPLSPSVTEASDLALRLGRLRHDNSEWVPSARRRFVPRKPESLAADKPGLLRVLAAVHEAADAMTRSALADLGGIQAADGAGRLYMSNRIVGEGRRPYASLAGYRAHLLKNAYRIGIEASLRAATALDSVAVQAGTPSKTLALVRDAAGETLPAEPGYELDAETFTARRLPYFDAPAHALLRSQSKLEAEAKAVIRAYMDDGLSIRECADRFTATSSVISSLLAFHGCKRLSRWDLSQTGQDANEDQAIKPQGPAAGPAPSGDAPMTSLLNELGIDDVAVRMRAVAIDKASSDLLRQVASGAVDTGPKQKRTAAQLAAMDMPAGPATTRQFSLVVEEQLPGPVSLPQDLRRKENRRSR